jgi:hypothetical protein
MIRFFARVFGIGSGVAAMVTIGVTLLEEPVIILEVNPFLRIIELVWISLGIICLASELSRK